MYCILLAIRLPFVNKLELRVELSTVAGELLLVYVQILSRCPACFH